MMGIGKLGEHAEGHGIPVLNEREIRAAAGLLFVLFGLVAYVVLVAMLFHASFGVRPHALFGG